MARRYETITELYRKTVAGLAELSDHGLPQLPPAL